MSDSAISPQRYRIGRPLGRGAFGEVVEALDTVLERPVAIKRLPASATIPALARRALLHEARLASSAGRAAVQIFDLLDVGPECWLVMELVPGGSLASRMAHGVDSHEAAGIAVSAADRLAELHDVGIVHGDIHTGNLLLRRADDVAYSDFGLAKLRPASQRGNRGRSHAVTIQDDTRALAQVIADLFRRASLPEPHAVSRLISSAGRRAPTDGRSLAAAIRTDLGLGRRAPSTVARDLAEAADAVKEGRIETSIRMLTDAIHRSPTDPSLRRNLAYVRWMAGERQRAVWELEAAVAMAPADRTAATVLRNWRIALEELGE